MMKITLDSGLEVYVDAFKFSFTYRGLLEGMPNERINKLIYDRQKCPSDWGERRTLKIQPPDEDFQKELKSSVYAVWLTCLTPKNNDFDGSELVVIWFADDPEGQSIRKIIEEGVRGIDWYANAEDYYY